MKGSVFKTMKHLGVFPKEVPTGTSKLAYYIEAGFQKITPTNRKITEASK
jgi:hydrogenase small subunit